MSDLSTYPPEWPAVSLGVKIAAGFRCVRCGHPNGRYSPPGNDHEAAVCALMDELDVNGVRIYRLEDGSAWLRHYLIPCDERCTHDPTVVVHRILTVHHLDGVKANLAWWNLAALCQRCHLEIQGRVKMDQGYLHPHSRWFLPYVAGYYAKTFAGLDLTRGEVEARLVELLGLGQPHLREHYLERLGVAGATA